MALRVCGIKDFGKAATGDEGKKRNTLRDCNRYAIRVYIIHFSGYEWRSGRGPLLTQGT